MTIRESTSGDAAGAAWTTVSFMCPSCGWTGEFDNRFASWCEGCGLGADPTLKAGLKPRVIRRRERARKRSVDQVEQLRTAESLRPTTATGVAVTVLATLVQLTVAFVAGGSIWLLFDSHIAIRLFGLLGLAVAFVGRPRLFSRKPKPVDPWLGRAEAPRLFALLDGCAAELGVRTPERVAFDGRYNAGTMRRGFPPRPYLVIGAPLWAVLSGQERVALLSHELAHQANGDVSHGVWAGSAQRSLAELLVLFNPRQSRAERLVTGRRTAMVSTTRIMGLTNSRVGNTALLADLLAPVFAVLVLGPLYLLMLGYRRALRSLDLASGHRAEYLADELAARVGSTAGAIGVMDALALTESATYFLRQNQSKSTTQLLDYLRSIPDHEKRRRTLLQETYGTRIDATHPPTFLRRALLAARPEQPGTVHLDEAASTAIDTEIVQRSARLKTVPKQR